MSNALLLSNIHLPLPETVERQLDGPTTAGPAPDIIKYAAIFASAFADSYSPSHKDMQRRVRDWARYMVPAYENQLSGHGLLQKALQEIVSETYSFDNFYAAWIKYGGTLWRHSHVPTSSGLPLTFDPAQAPGPELITRDIFRSQIRRSREAMKENPKLADIPKLSEACEMIRGYFAEISDSDDEQLENYFTGADSKFRNFARPRLALLKKAKRFLEETRENSGFEVVQTIVRVMISGLGLGEAAIQVTREPVNRMWNTLLKERVYEAAMVKAADMSDLEGWAPTLEYVNTFLPGGGDTSDEDSTGPSKRQDISDALARAEDRARVAWGIHRILDSSRP
ncbi:hypothetical protein C8R46DRAFT_1226051 [Mycena filopes]|nr:hypothetical protein C8R46DRAFT_1226051 [Mycena filopes]